MRACVNMLLQTWDINSIKYPFKYPCLKVGALLPRFGVCAGWAGLGWAGLQAACVDQRMAQVLALSLLGVRYICTCNHVTNTAAFTRIVGTDNSTTDD